MKSLVELYTLLLERFKENNPNANEFLSYICNNITELYQNGKITEEEKLKIFAHFENELPSPTKHTAFFEHDLFDGNLVWFITARNPKLAHSLRVQILTNIIANLKEQK